MTNSEMKSKVMTIGNRLSARMVKRAAFIAAWRIVKAGEIELSVKGTSFGSRPEALRRLATKYSAEQIRTFLAPEKNNPADNRACAVYVGINGGKGMYRIGYLPREYAAAAVNLKAKGLQVIGGSYGRGAVVRLAV